MTKKDYILIAAAITSGRRVVSYETKADATLDGVSRLIAEALQRDNPRFDRARFLAACGVQL